MSLPRMDRALLRGFERVSVPTMDLLATQPTLKRMATWHGRNVGRRFVRALTKNLWQVHGLEELQGIRAPRGVVLVSNHRSLFDMYVASAILYERTELLRKLYFPVRTTYFYTHPAGLLINLAISGGAMWPPVFRDERKAAMNGVGLEQAAWMLRGGGATIGIHPEGHRNPDPDPYSYLPPRSGVGRLLRAAPPETLLVPYYIRGLTSDFAEQVRRNFQSPPAPPIEIEFGAPEAAADVARGDDAPTIARRVMDRVVELGERNRARRSRGEESGSGNARAASVA